jgi:NADH-quinone oxidoreductase subunit J
MDVPLETVRDAIFWFLAVNAVFWGWRVFRTDNMVRAAYFLMLSFLAVGFVLLQLQADFLGVITILMMVGEMVIMAVYMVIFMENPAGLRPMTMIHQIWAARVAAVVSFVVLATVAVVVDWPVRAGRLPADDITQLGQAMMSQDMLVFMSAGVALFTSMIASVAMTLGRGRYDRYGDRLERRRPLDRPLPEEKGVGR